MSPDKEAILGGAYIAGLEEHAMRDIPLETLSLAEIMARSPASIRLALDRHLHCVGCPIAPFHTLDDAAFEHGVMADELIAAMEAAIRGELKDGRA